VQRGGGGTIIVTADAVTGLGASGGPSMTRSEPSTTSSAEQLGIELAREMRRRWQCGEQPPAEEFLARHPELMQRPEAAVELIYEEFCLREFAGQPDVEEDILHRFPQWAAPLRVMLDCHRRLLRADRDGPSFPMVGECVGEFRLLAELVRGSRGRVFLATQTALADRLVVLKITPLDGGEHLSLARLQHTNIVPLYSVLDDAARNIRVLCMPYFGRATLASLLELLAPVPIEARTGRQIVEAVDRLQQASSVTPALQGAARQMLEKVSYVQAMCWIAACLADALHFAHERGVVHLDLKPSNVLLATDGQPMLLDFHLARAPIRAHRPLRDNVGGTPPYMPPEQQAAMQALQFGEIVELDVDARADVYALGAILYESLGGQLAVKWNSPPLAEINPAISVGLSDIVARCVANLPGNRYADAAALADDLRRHLTDQPLVGVRNRSITERWHKWRRRRPGRVRAAVMAAVVTLAVLGLLAAASIYLHDRHAQAELALYDGQRQLQNQPQAAEAVKTLERGVMLLEGLPFEVELRGQLHEQLVAARRLQLALQLHELADEVRVLYGSADAIPPQRLRPLAARCAALWPKRDAILGPPGPMRRPELSADLQDIAIFAASATEDGVALRLLDEIQTTFGASAVVEHERQIRRGEKLSVTTAPRSAWEHYALGRALLASGDLKRAAHELSEARRLDPAGHWSNFYYGVCAYRTGRHEDAVAAFSVCIGAAPKVSGYFYNRALAYAALDRREQALHDYDRALAIDPAHADAALNRGVLHLKQKRLDRAAADLRLALHLGADAATVHYDLALVHLAAGDARAAKQQVELALARNPSHVESRELGRSLK
jgi:serine/threonine protein kinase/tetratricopeptide (TPR) repeat protein